MFDVNLSIEEENTTAASICYDSHSSKYAKSSHLKNIKSKKRFLQQKRKHSNNNLKEEIGDADFLKSDTYSTRGDNDNYNEHEVSFDEITNDKDSLNTNSELNYYTLKKGLSSPSYEYVQFTHVFNQN